MSLSSGKRGLTLDVSDRRERFVVHRFERFKINEHLTIECAGTRCCRNEPAGGRVKRVISPQLFGKLRSGMKLLEVHDPDTGARWDVRQATYESILLILRQAKKSSGTVEMAFSAFCHNEPQNAMSHSKTSVFRRPSTPLGQPSPRKNSQVQALLGDVDTHRLMAQKRLQLRILSLWLNNPESYIAICNMRMNMMQERLVGGSPGQGTKGCRSVSTDELSGSLSADESCKDFIADDLQARQTMPHDVPIRHVGLRVQHDHRGDGVVASLMPDGRVAVLFDHGDLHRYHARSFHKLKPIHAQSPPLPPGTGKEHAERLCASQTSKSELLGASVVHEVRGQGWVICAMPDSRRVVLYGDGDVQSYQPSEVEQLTLGDMEQVMKDISEAADDADFMQF